MNCPHCLSSQTYALKKKTQLGYRQYYCRRCYLYRAMDKAGNLIDVYLSDRRDQGAADAFFAQCTEALRPELHR